MSVYLLIQSKQDSGIQMYDDEKMVGSEAEVTPGSPKDYRLARYSNAPIEVPQWLLYPYISFGMTKVVHGYPGSGKSSMLLDHVVRASRGEVLPDGSRLAKPIPTIYQCTDSGSMRVTKQMLINAGQI